MYPASKDEIKNIISDRGLNIPQEVVLDKCCAACDRYSVTAKGLVDQLEAFLLDSRIDKITLDIWGKFELKMKQSNHRMVKHEYDSATPSVSVPQGKRSNSGFTPIDDRGSKIARITPEPYSSASQKASVSSSEPTAAPGSAFKNRTNQGAVVTDFNPTLAKRGVFEPSAVHPLGMRCKVTIDDVDFENVSQRYRYMYTTLDERAHALEKHLLRVQKDMCAFANLSEEDLHPVGAPAQGSVWVCGRICCEDMSVKFGKDNVALEGSASLSRGRRVALDLDKLKEFALFPGQIVLIEGVNSMGRKMVVQRVLNGFSCSLSRSAPGALMDIHYSSKCQNGNPLNIVVASGPFTTSDSLEYAPLEQLLQNIIRDKPDVLILVGPFVDVSQPLLATGDVVLTDINDDGDIVGDHPASYEMVFLEKIVRDNLSALFNSEEEYGIIPTNIIIIPSLLDGHHEAVYPQPPFGDRDAVKASFFEEALGILDIPFSKENDARKRVHLLPNPCMFRINEVLFGATSFDVVTGLSADEFHPDPFGGADRMSRLMNHILQQQSFFPQFPPPANMTSQLDLRQSKHWTMKIAPDVLIVPSPKLAHAVKEITGTLVINPGPLARGAMGGTYAELNIHPFKEEELRDAALHTGESLPHAVPSRTRVTVLRI